MPGAAIAATVATVASGAIGASKQAKAAKQAANAQVAAADAATGFQREAYYDQRGLATPAIQAGAQAKARQMLMMGFSQAEVKQFLNSTSASIDGGGGAGGAGGAEWVDDWQWQPNSPSYGFRVAEGQKALERGAAARGGLFSGDTGMALTRYGQEQGSREFEADYSRFGGLSGSGEQSTNVVIDAAGNFGNQAAGNELYKGDARASGFRAKGDAEANFWGRTVPGAIGATYGYGKQNWGWGQ